MASTIKPNRIEIHVLIRFLKSLWEDNREYKKTELQMAARVNYGALQRYLNYMKAEGMVVVKESENGSQLVSITKTGIQTYFVLSKWQSMGGQFEGGRGL